MSAPYPTDLYPGCPCRICMQSWSAFIRMALCPECGDKRCPGATDHRWHPAAARTEPAPTSEETA